MVDVKICGLSTPETVDGAIAAGAALVGLVFYPKSPRHVSLDKAASLAARAAARRGSWPSSSMHEMRRSPPSTAVNPDLFQAHGSETPERDRRHKGTYGQAGDQGDQGQGRNRHRGG
jgi:phosphoribosylanthranilate isomerase